MDVVGGVTRTQPNDRRSDQLDHRPDGSYTPLAHGVTDRGSVRRAAFRVLSRAEEDMMTKVTTAATIKGRTVAMALLVFALIACGGPGTTPPPQNGDDNGNGNGNGDGNGDLACSLNALGVDTSHSDRVGPRGDPMPATYAPLGGSAAFNAPEAFAGSTGMVSGGLGRSGSGGYASRCPATRTSVDAHQA